MQKAPSRSAIAATACHPGPRPQYQPDNSAAQAPIACPDASHSRGCQSTTAESGSLAAQPRPAPATTGSPANRAAPGRTTALPAPEREGSPRIRQSMHDYRRMNVMTAFKRLTATDQAASRGRMTEAAMADEPEDPDAAADRLEAALERIARLAAPCNPATASDDRARTSICRSRKSPTTGLADRPVAGGTRQTRTRLNRR